MWNYHFPAFAYVQVLPNTKCPAGKDHYSPGFAQTVAHPTYQERVRTAVECGTSNCGVPLHLNDFVVLDVDCVFVDDHGVKQVDTMLLECVKRALPARNHTYCVVSNPLPGLVDFLSAAACLISLFCMSVCASGSDQTWWISFLLPQHRSQGHGQDYQGLPRSVEIVWRRFDVWQIAHRRCLLQGGRHSLSANGEAQPVLAWLHVRGDASGSAATRELPTPRPPTAAAEGHHPLEGWPAQSHRGLRRR